MLTVLLQDVQEVVEYDDGGADYGGDYGGDDDGGGDW